MKVARLASLATVLLSANARAQEIDIDRPLMNTQHSPHHAELERKPDFEFDVRMPLRYGFAYAGITETPAMSLSYGLDADVARVAPDLNLELVCDVDSFSQPQISDDDRRSSFLQIGIGAGLFYLTKDDVGLGFDATLGLTFDVRDLVGAGFGVRAYVYPYYRRIADWDVRKKSDIFVALRSSLSLWILARADFTSDGTAPTVAFGGSIDLVRAVFLPYSNLLATAFR